MRISIMSLVSASGVIVYGYAAMVAALTFIGHDEWRRFTSPRYIFDPGANTANLALVLIGLVAIAAGTSIKRLERKLSNERDESPTASK